MDSTASPAHKVTPAALMRPTLAFRRPTMPATVAATNNQPMTSAAVLSATSAPSV